MAKITLTRPFFVSVLSVLTVLLIWQNVSAQRAPRSEPRSNTAITDTAEPVEAPAEAVPEAEPAKEPSYGTMTVDGETLSIVVEECRLIPYGGDTFRVDGKARDDAGSILYFTLVLGRSQIIVNRKEPERVSITYSTPRSNAEIALQVDGSTVTMDGKFGIGRGQTDHSIQMSFDCSS